VKVENAGFDSKVCIDLSTTVGDVVEMLARSPKPQQKCVAFSNLFFFFAYNSYSYVGIVCRFCFQDSAHIRLVISDPFVLSAFSRVILIL